MDCIPFEKVTVQEAKAVMDGPSVQTMERNWAATRSKEAGAKNAELTEQAWQWLDAIPVEIQPGGLVQRFPRITNKLAEVWNRPHQCERYLDALVLDNRGTRKGFPADVTAELAKLKVHYLSHVVVQRFDAWGARIDV
jgi:hypothetical protein